MKVVRVWDRRGSEESIRDRIMAATPQHFTRAMARLSGMRARPPAVTDVYTDQVAQVPLLHDAEGSAPQRTVP